MADKPVAQLESKQVDLEVPYLTRDTFVDPARRMPLLTEPTKWRLVAAEPVNKLAIRTITREISSLNWGITPIDKKYDAAARYYTNVLGDFSLLVKKVLRSVCILPQGGAWEVGWIRPGVFPYEEERGTVSFVKHIDAGTLHPTNPITNPYTPIVQLDPNISIRKVLFTKEEILRFIAYPYDEWDKEWWQESPTMSSFLAIEALSRIYIYYLKQLRDTPVVGILDLMDFTRDSAQNWAKSFREMIEGIDPIKIPVIYEHNNAAHWIPMGRNPTELSIQEQFKQYTELILSNYGLSVDDLRIFSGKGTTKGGSATNRKITTQSGISFWAELVKDNVQSLLPWYLIFGYTDPDIEEERSKAQIRAADARTLQTLNWLPIKERVKQAQKWKTIDIEVDPDAIQKEFEKQQQEMLKNAQNVAGRGMPSPRPGQLKKGEGRTRDNLEDDAKDNAAIGTRVFSKARTDAIGIIEKAVRKIVNRGKPEEPPKPQVYGERAQRAAILFRDLLRVAFDKVGDNLTEALVDRLLTAAKTQLAKTVNKPLQKADEDEEEERARVEELLDDLIDDVYDVNISDEEIVERIIEIYQLAYADGLLGSAEDIQNIIHEDNPDVPSMVNMQFNVVSDEVKEYLRELTLETIRNINDGTRYYLKQFIRDGALKGMSSYELQKVIKENLFNLPEEEQEKLSESRIRSITNYELNKIDSIARLAQMEHVGLTLKRWVTRAVDVCKLCLRNEAQGSVPLDYMYEDVFGEGTKTPPGHPATCHCTLAADKEELSNLGTTPEYWSGD